MDFDLQTFLRDSRQETREDHQGLVERVEQGFDRLESSLALHAKEDATIAAMLNTRLIALESTDKTVRYLVRTLFGGVILFAYDALKNHLHWLGGA